MGNQLSGIAPSQILPVETYLSDLNNKYYQEITFESSLGNTRFLKVLKAQTEEGLIVIKVFVIHDSSLSLVQYKKQLEDVYNKLQDAPNCLPFHYCELSERAAFMIRPYMKSSLYERISTRPFLSLIEKKWIAFQILSGLKQAHQNNVCHGDLKLENIFVTCWSWVIISDFASYKPVLLPEDNPSNYTYFFDTSAKRVCYIAPERFVKTCRREDEQLFVLKDVKDDSLSSSMDIFSAGCVLAELFTEGVVPFDFPQLLRFRTDNYYPTKVLDQIHDEGIRSLIEHMICKDPSSRLSADAYLEQERDRVFPESFYSIFWPLMKQFSILPSLSSDARIKRISLCLPDILNALFPEENSLHLDEESLPANALTRKSEILIIIVTMVTSSIRTQKILKSKLMTLEILCDLASFCHDEVILDRILPFILYLLQFGEDEVRARSISALSHCLSMINTVPRSEVNIFSDYIFPNIRDVTHDESVEVRKTFAMYIGTIADTSSRFLEYAHLQDIVPNFEAEISGLHKEVQQKVASLFSDPSNLVKRTLIEYSAIKLCIFFRSQKANDVILSHMITFLNEKRDPFLRHSFFKNIVGVATCIGPHCATILQPLLLQGLSDTEESVIVSAINSMGSLTEVGFFSHQLIYELLEDTLPLLIHPNFWIREAVVELIAKVSKMLPLAAVLAIIKKISKLYLSQDIIQFDKEVSVLSSLSPQVPRDLYNTLVKSPNVEVLVKILHGAVKRQKSLKDLPNDEEIGDLQTRNLLRRLNGAGLNEENIKYIFALQDHLIRVQRHKKTCESSHAVKQPILGKLDCDFGIRETPLPSCYKLISGESLEMPSLSSSNHGSVTSTSPIMNEEWLTMFGGTSAPSMGSTAFFQPGDQRSLSPLRADLSSSSSPSSKNEEIQVSEYVSECQKDFESILTSKKKEFIRILHQQKASSSFSVDSLFPDNWKPKGNLIAHLHEHKGAVNRIVQLKDKPSFFASCSSDGSLKIWDCNKTERKFPIIKSKFTYIKQGGVLTSLACSLGGDLLASSSKNGSIHILRTDKQLLLTSRQLDKEKEGYAVDMNFMDYGSQSILTYATMYGEIIGWDIRSPTIAWKLNNDVKNGLITSYVIHKQDMWLAAGTSRGYHTCWDLRFQLPISLVKHSRESSVRRIGIHPLEPSCIVSALTDNNEVSFLKLATSSRMRTLWASSEQPLKPQSQKSSSSICGLALGQTESGGLFVVTGGQDCILRYWDMQRPQESFYVADSGHRYTPPTVKYKMQIVDGSEVILENAMKATNDGAPDEPQYRGAIPPPTGHKDTITDVLLVSSPQKLIVTSAYDGTIKIWK